MVICATEQLFGFSVCRHFCVVFFFAIFVYFFWPCHQIIMKFQGPVQTEIRNMFEDQKQVKKATVEY